MLIARAKTVETNPDSIQSRFQRTVEAQDYLKDILPYAGDMHKFRQQKTQQMQKLQKLTQTELDDFRVPL